MKTETRIGNLKDGEFVAQLKIEGVDEAFTYGPFKTRNEAALFVENKEREVIRIISKALNENEGKEE